MIVAAAIRYRGAVYALPAPARHSDVIRWMVETGQDDHVPATAEQGFIDSEAGFVPRDEAAYIALRDGQPLRDPVIVGGELYSENLW